MANLIDLITIACDDAKPCPTSGGSVKDCIKCCYDIVVKVLNNETIIRAIWPLEEDENKC